MCGAASCARFRAVGRNASGLLAILALLAGCPAGVEKSPEKSSKRLAIANDYVNATASDPFTVTVNANDGAGSGVNDVHVYVCTVSDCSSRSSLGDPTVSPYSVSWTLPAGFVEGGEEPSAAARRELREETGYESELWKWLGTFTVDGNRGCGRAHFYLADACWRSVEPIANDHSPIEVRLLAVDHVMASLRRDEIAELGTAAGLGLALLELAAVETKMARTAI